MKSFLTLFILLMSYLWCSAQALTATNIKVTSPPVQSTVGNIARLFSVSSSGLGETVTPSKCWDAIVVGKTATTIKTDLSLQNVDNTADVDKPVSTAQQTELNLKANLAGGAAFTGAVSTTTSLTVGSGGTAVLKILSATASLDFSAIGTPGALFHEDLTVTVTGAAVGDVVALGVPNSSVTTAAFFTGWVSAADTVTVRRTIPASSFNQDPASGTFRVMVTKF